MTATEEDVAKIRHGRAVDIAGAVAVEVGEGFHQPDRTGMPGQPRRRHAIPCKVVLL